MTDIPSSSEAAHSSVVTFPTASTATATTALPHCDAPACAGMPAGFISCEDGIHELREDQDGNVVPTRICSQLIVKGRCRNTIGHGWSRVLAVRDPDGTWHNLVLDAQKLAKSPTVALDPLIDRGFELAPVSKAAESVMQLLRSWQPDARYLRIDRLGWTSDQHDAFVLGSGEVIGSALVATDSVSAAISAAIHTRGTAESWKTEVAALCVGNPLMLLAVSHALTGPLLSVLGQNGGGFHLRGSSSCGKSTIQYLATSVWGARPLLQSWDGTPSGFEGIAAACNDTLLNIEELHKADPRTVGDIVYMLANGQGRLRSRSNGNLQTPQRWRVPVLSSGEISLEDHMASAGRTTFAGQDVRLINLEAECRAYGGFDALHGASGASAFAEQADHACLKSYGHAGPCFVKLVMANTDKMANWHSVVDGFCRVMASEADVPPGDRQVRRILRRFAIAALAGELATRAGITGWPPGAAKAAAREMFLQWFEMQDATTNEEIAATVQRTGDHVSTHKDRFQTIGTTDHDPVDGWRDQYTFYIRPECWLTIHDGKDPVAAARLHAEAGLLKTQKGSGHQYRMGRSVPDRPRVYAVHATRLLGASAP